MTPTSDSPVFVGFYICGTRSEEQAHQLRVTLQTHGLGHDITAIRHMNSSKVNAPFIAIFCRNIGLKYPSRPLVYLDVAARVRSYPSLFYQFDCDVAIPPGDSDVPPSSPLFFRSGVVATEICNSWIAAIRLNRSPSDQRMLQRVLQQLDRRWRVCILPPEYAQRGNLIAGIGSPVIEHLEVSQPSEQTDHLALRSKLLRTRWDRVRGSRWTLAELDQVVQASAQYLPRISGEEVSIVTSCDASYALGALVLICSLRPFYDGTVMVFDHGMTSPQVDLLREAGAQVEEEQSKLPRDMPDRTMFTKPFILQQVEGPQVLWLDADCVVCNPIHELLRVLRRQFVIMSHCFPTVDTFNDPALYQLLPSFPLTQKGTEATLINAGVIACDNTRELDRAILRSWCDLILVAARNDTIRRVLRWHDESALQWVIESKGLTNCVTQRKDWNRFATIGRAWNPEFSSVERAESPVELMRSVRNSSDTILHFTGRHNGGKYWRSWSWPF